MGLLKLGHQSCRQFKVIEWAKHLNRESWVKETWHFVESCCETTFIARLTLKVFLKCTF